MTCWAVSCSLLKPEWALWKPTSFCCHSFRVEIKTCLKEQTNLVTISKTTAWEPHVDLALASCPSHSLSFASQEKPHMWWPYWEETAKLRCGGAISHHWRFVLGADLHTGAYWREENTLVAIRRKGKGWCWVETGTQLIRHPFTTKMASVIVSKLELVSSL